MSFSVFERESLATLSLAEDSEILRDRQRPEHLRDGNYDAQYDFRTLFYDAFLSSDRTQVRLIGPVLSNLAQYVLAGNIYDVSNSGRRKGLPFKLCQKLKVTYLDIELPAPADEAPLLKFDFGKLGVFKHRIVSNEESLFAGRRVAFTLFKYEPLEWLHDWVDFNSKYHGADAFLIYHNDSDTFSSVDVMSVLKSVPGVKAAAALNWAFPYGPDGSEGDHWESNFCQVGMMAHARFRFLGQARSALNGDLDELIVTKGHRSIFDIVEQSPHGYVQVPAVWSGCGGDDPKTSSILDRRHRQMTHIVDGTAERPAQNKWAIIPRSCPEDGRWLAHGIGRVQGDLLDFHEAGLRHFRDLNTHWKLARDSSGGVIEQDESLISAYKEIGWID